MDAGCKLHTISQRYCQAGFGTILAQEKTGTKCMTQEHPTFGKVEMCVCNTELCNGSPDEPHEGKN